MTFDKLVTCKSNLIKRDLVSNDTILVVTKFKKCEICQQKIIDQLTIERHVLMSSYFCTHVSRLLNFDTDDLVSFNTKYFFLNLDY